MRENELTRVFHKDFGELGVDLVDDQYIIRFHIEFIRGGIGEVVVSEDGVES